MNTLERVFVCHDVSEERKLKLVCKCLKGRISDWWDDLLVIRQRRGKGKLRDWDNMKKKLKQHYLPSTCPPTEQSRIVSSSKQQISNCDGSGQLFPAVTVKKHKYDTDSRSGQPFHTYSKACSLPNVGTTNIFGCGQKGRAENGLVAAQNQFTESVLEAANQSQSGAFNGFKCGDPCSKPLVGEKPWETAVRYLPVLNL